MMKSVNMMKIFLAALLLAAVLTSCSDNGDSKETYPLTFEKDSYEIGRLMETSIMIRSGNRDYTLSVGNPSIIEAKIDLGSETGMGYIVVTGIQKGETVLSVTDNIAKETVKLHIKVTDGYLSFKIHDSDHPALTNEIIMFLVNNEKRTCYFASVNDPGIVAQGIYEFSVEPGADDNTRMPYLTLTYSSDEKGRFTEAAVVPTPHKFDISGSSEATYILCDRILGIDWEELAEGEPDNSLSKSLERIYLLELKEVNTGYKVSSHLISYTTLPEGILQ